MSNIRGLAAAVALFGSVAVGFTAAGVVATTGTAAAASATWTASNGPDTSGLDPTPNASSFYPTSVSCASATSCVAVGTYDYGNPSSEIPFIETGTEADGEWTWDIEDAPLGGLDPVLTEEASEPHGEATLSSVSCGSPTYCVAVGQYGSGQPDEGGENPLIETGTSSGNGEWSWTDEGLSPSGLDPAPYTYNTGDEADTGAFYLDGVSCTGTSCVAVGSYESLLDGSINSTPMIETESSGSWEATSEVPTDLDPAPSPDFYPFLSAVSCSSATTCLAVGYYYDDSTEENAWVNTGTESDGTWTWVASNVTDPDPTSSSYYYEFTGVACPSTTECIAVGTGQNDDIIETGTYNAGAWTWVVSTGVTGDQYLGMSGVTCVSTTSCIAVGNATGSKIESGTQSGGVWTWSDTAIPTSGLDPAPATNPSPTLAGLSCVTTTCVGAGTYTDADSTRDLMIVTGVLAPSPTVSSVSPGGGVLAGGNTVTITGSDFQDSTLTFKGVDFVTSGGTPQVLAGTDPSVDSGTQITVMAPDATSAAGGAASLSTQVQVVFTEKADPSTQVIATAAAGSGANVLTYVFGAPVVTSVAPGAGPLDGGNTITITGSGFSNPALTFSNVTFDPLGDTDGSKSFDGTHATVDSDTQITVTAPDATTAADGTSVLNTKMQVVFEEASDPSNQVLAVTDSTGNPNILTYVFGAPTVTSIAPPGGPLAGGNTVTIIGSGFENPDLNFDQVSFDPTTDTTGNEAMAGSDATVVSDTEITVTAPDATTAADGASTLPAKISVSFTDPSNGDAKVTAVPGSSENSSVFNYVFGAPVVDSISPAAGPLAGGNTVTITGSGFQNASLTFEKVLFDPDSDTDGSEALRGSLATVVSDTEITVTAPDATAAAGVEPTLDTTVDVDFTDDAADDAAVQATPASTGATAYTFGAPVVDSVTPAAGPLAGGNTVTITGSGFDDATLTFQGVQFDPTTDTDGSQALDGLDATVVSDTEITVTAPDATTAAGAANTLETDIKVEFVSSPSNTTVEATDSGTDVNAYLFGAPVVDSVAPVAGPLAGGNTVTLTGSGFEGSGLSLDKVVFDPTSDHSDDSSAGIEGTDATVVSDTEITVTAPDATAAAAGKSTLSTYVFAYFTDAADPDNPVQALPATLNNGILDYGFGVPVIDSVDPVHGVLVGGNTVTITGSGFDTPGLTLDGVNFDPTADSDVTAPLAGTDATVVSDTEITVTAPNASGSAAAASGGAVETEVEVDFSGLGGQSGIAALPTSPGDNDYEFGAPTIDSVSPTAGPLAGGNTVTITGDGFEDAGLVLDKVQFAPSGGGTPLEGGDVTVVSDTEITVTAPDATLAASPASILSTSVMASFSLEADPDSPFNAVTSEGGSSAYDFGVPQVTSVDPTEGSQDGGDTVTITGSGFKDNPDLALTSVQFDPGGGHAAVDGTDATVVSDTKVTVTTPDVSSQAAGAPTYATTVVLNFEDVGNGNAPVTAVLSSGGSDAFDFDLPTIESISPNRGPLTGGNVITVTGSGFEDLGLVYDSLGFTPQGSGTPLAASDVTVVSDTEITATVPDGTEAAAGQPAFMSTLVATFTDPDAADASVQSVPASAGDDTYWFGIPTVASVSPASGPLDGGNEVTITGSGFEDPGLTLNKVEFTPSGGTALDGTDATVVSDTEITVDAPDATAAAGIHPSLAASVMAVFDFEGSQTQVGSSPAEAGDDQYTFARPTISSMMPSIGPLAGGGTVTITGTGFEDLGLDMPTVTFTPTGGGDAPAGAGTDVTVVSDTELTVVAPDMTEAADGQPALDTSVTISFENPDVEAATVDSVPVSPGDDDYWFGPPDLDSVDPTAGPLDGGNTVTLTGEGFKDAGLTLTGVTFTPTNSTDPSDDLQGTSPTVVSDTEITVVAPDASTAAGDAATYATTVTLHFSDGSETGQDITSYSDEGANDYDFGTPLVTSVTPPVGALDGGNTVTITGTGFDNPDLDLASVTFEPNGEDNPSDALDGVDPTVVSDTEITVTAPDASTDAGDQSYLATTVTVSFNDPGDADATVEAAVQHSGDNDYEFGTPVIDSVSPAVGPLAGGDEVTIAGTGFENPDLTFDGISFTPGGDDADAIAGVDPVVVSDTEITVTAPDATDAANGASTLDTTVSVDYTDAADGDAEVASAPAAEGDNDYSFGEPIVDSVSPDEGPLDGGQTITVTGSGFENPDLSFDGVIFEPQGEDDSSARVAPHNEVQDGLTGTDATVVSDTEIMVTTPDATSAADGEDTLDTAVAVDFTDTGDGGAQVASTLGQGGTDDYTFSALPSSPTHVAALAGVGSAMVTWSAPETSGDDPLTSYTVTSVPGGIATTVSGSSTAATLSGLDVGTGYYFDVTATSDEGTSPPASSNMIVPTSTPVVDTTSATSTTPGATVVTSPVTAAGGASLTASATGTGTVGTGTYDVDPVAQLSAGADYFDVDVSDDNTFSVLTFTVCGLAPGQSLEWWNATVDAWQAMSEQTMPSGTPLCVTATVTSNTSPSIAQLYGTVIAVVGSTGYREVGADGGVFAYGASFDGSASALHLNQPIVGMAPTADGGGYWLVGADGGVFSYGDASFYGSLATRHLNRTVVAIAATPDGGGYWLVGADGGVFNFGDAPFEGSLVSDHVTLNSPVVGIAVTPSGNGYWLVAADGGVFAFGDANFWGSAATLHLDSPVVGIAAGPGGKGYWLVGSDGGVFAYGDAPFEGSMGGQRLNGPMVGVAATADGKGYWLVGSDGGVFAYGDANFVGSPGGTRLAAKMVGLAS